MKSMKSMIVMLALLVAGCDKQPEKSAPAPTQDPSEVVKEPVQEPATSPTSNRAKPKNLGDLLDGVDSITIAERSIQTADMGGEAAHPKVTNITDPEAIRKFVLAAGKRTRSTPIDADAPCIIWADAVFQANGRSLASFAVGCAPGEFQEFRDMRAKKKYLPKSPERLKELL